MENVRILNILAAAVLGVMPSQSFAAGGHTSLVPVLRPVPADLATGDDIMEQELTPTLVSGSSDAGFQRWIRGFESRARGAGISSGTFQAAFRDARYLDDVIARDRNQAEFTKQIWEYLDGAVSEPRIRNGQRALRRNARVLDQVEAHYRVEKEIVAAVWGLESAYGETRGSTPLISALATLSYDGRRGRFFEAQLIAALKILQNGDVRPRDMTGSWAGAMGHTQFIPTSYLEYAQDFTGDGKRDIWSDNPADALASTASYLKRHGWTFGQPWGVEVVLPQGFNYGLAGAGTKKSPQQWASLGVRGANGGAVANHGRASILLPGGAQGAAFMIFDNFHVIERYNAADAYVIGVGHLADRLAGGPAIQASWPRGYAPLSFRQKQQLQRRLTRAGFDTDGTDGIIGPNTIAAIRAFQESIGVTADGFASQDVLNRLRNR